LKSRHNHIQEEFEAPIRRWVPPAHLVMVVLISSSRKRTSNSKS
jgi:hypothetical protein